MGIPTYVYVIFCVLLYIGITRCFPKVIKVKRLFITPFIFILLSIRGMVSLFDIGTIEIFSWMIGCGIGLLLGYLHISNRQVQADHRRQLIRLPGDGSMLILLLTIFFFEFFVHYSIAANWDIATTRSFVIISILILGAIAGMSIGRTIHYFKKYKSALNTSLQELNK